MSRHQVIGIVAAGMLACVMPLDAASAESLVTVPSQGFQASGAEISGWTWLRSQGNTAEWTWGAVQATPAAACVNFSLLVTNTVNGGSGHDGRIQVAIVPSEGSPRPPVTLTLKNPFRPIVSSNTGGVGYQAYGAICSTDLRKAAVRGFKIRMEWNNHASGHIAVRQEGAVLAYTR